MVFYTWGEAALGPKYDPDFGKEIEWDIPLLEGYNYTFPNNTSKDPGSHHFKGIINPTLNQEVITWGADIVWVWGWAFDSHLKAIRYFNGKVPVWFRGDSTLLDEPKGFKFKKILRRVFLTWVYRNLDKAFYVGTHNKAYFIKHGLKEKQLVYAPHAIDNVRFSLEKSQYFSILEKLRIELNIENTDTVFLFAGKLESKKNPFFMLELAKHLKGGNYKFLIVGNGQLQKELIMASVKDNRIKYLGFQNQSMMPCLYRLASYFVLPSNGPSETWGLALNEALASGTPIIASNKCGGAFDLINSQNGYLLNSQLPNFKALETWIDKFDLDEFRIQNAIFFERFSFDFIVNQIISNC
jgi:glycosyltransferase involved in cell wall biosynthesis